MTRLKDSTTDPSDSRATSSNDRARSIALWAGLVATWGLARTLGLWRQLSCMIVALARAAVFFTTVGRLWFVPGPLLILSTITGSAWRRR